LPEKLGPVGRVGMGEKPVAVIVGLDGVPLGLLRRLAEEGVMPWLRGRLQRAVATETEVLVPYTAPSWATISTGVNPGKHGIYDFLVPAAGGEPRAASRLQDLEWPYVTEMAASAGASSVSVGVPFSWPPFVRRRHVVVSGWTSPGLEVWPPELRGRVLEALGGGLEPPRPGDLDSYVDTVVESAEREAALVEELMGSLEWRLFYLVMPQPDWAFHYTYGDVEEGGPRRGRVLRLFRVIDGLLRRIYESLPGPGLVVVASDHGFMVAREALNGNVLLERLGLLRRREERLSLRSRLVLRAARLLPSWLKSRLKYSSLAVLARRLGAAEAFDMSRLPIDYAASRAFFTSAYSLYTNPGLPPEEREAIAERLLGELGRYRHMFRVLARGRDYFWGPTVDKAPDIVVVPREGYNVTTRLMYRRVVEQGRWYVHSPRGALVLDTVDSPGPTPQLPPRRPVTTMDIAPTVLAWLGLPLDPGFDGEPLLAGIDVEGLGRRSYRLLARLGRGVARAAGLRGHG